MPQDQKLYTVNEVAEITLMTPRTIRNYLRSGALKGRKVGGQWRFTQEDVQALLGAKDVRTHMKQTQEDKLSAFLQGKEKHGDVSVCSIIDVYLPQHAIAQKCEQVCALFSVESQTPISFHFEYDDAAEKGRFVVFAPPALVIEVMKVFSDQ